MSQLTWFSFGMEWKVKHFLSSTTSKPIKMRLKMRWFFYRWHTKVFDFVKNSFLACTLVYVCRWWRTKYIKKIKRLSEIDNITKRCAQGIWGDCTHSEELLCHINFLCCWWVGAITTFASRFIRFHSLWPQIFKSPSNAKNNAWFFSSFNFCYKIIKNLAKLSNVITLQVTRQREINARHQKMLK